MIKIKPIEIFCGTGGVGKTTLATSRALFLAKSGLRVLLITIDPALRLKQILNMKHTEAGEIVTIPVSKFFNDLEAPNGHTFDALLLSPRATLQRINEKDGRKYPFENPILEILTRPNGGMTEIMGIIEVQFQVSQDKYDVVVLDTPPGKHFIDFLEGSAKIQRFFDQSFVDIFKYLGKSFERFEESKAKKVMNLIVSSGIKQLLKYLEKVTGTGFVETFIDAVGTLYRNRSYFMDALTFQNSLKETSKSNWFLVTAADQAKAREAFGLQKSAVVFMHKDNYLIINKCLSNDLKNWNPDKAHLIKLKDFLLQKEAELKAEGSRQFQNILEFTEISADSPESHVSALALQWPES